MRDPLKVKKQASESHFRYRDERLKNMRAYYLANKEIINARHKEYRKNNKEAIIQRNRARKKNILNQDHISQKEINKLLEKHDNKCFYCKIEVHRGINLHLDHETPLARGGEHKIENLVPACKSCNLRKGTKTAAEFMEQK